MHMQLSSFMKFWCTVNEILKSRDLPEMAYGEARDWWIEHCERDAVRLPVEPFPSCAIGA